MVIQFKYRAGIFGAWWKMIRFITDNVWIARERYRLSTYIYSRLLLMLRNYESSLVTRGRRNKQKPEQFSVDGRKQMLLQQLRSLEDSVLMVGVCESGDTAWPLSSHRLASRRFCPLATLCRQQRQMLSLLGFGVEAQNQVRTAFHILDHRFERMRWTTGCDGKVVSGMPATEIATNTGNFPLGCGGWSWPLSVIPSKCSPSGFAFRFSPDLLAELQSTDSTRSWESVLLNMPSKMPCAARSQILAVLLRALRPSVGCWWSMLVAAPQFPLVQSIWTGIGWFRRQIESVVVVDRRSVF